MKKKLLSSILYGGFFFGIILLFTHGIFNNYFEQDEWGAIGVTIHSSGLPWWNTFISRGVHFSPIGNAMWAVLYRTFGLEAGYYTCIQLFLHAIASFLVFVLSSKITNDKKIGLLTGILFATNARANQAFMHLAINTTVAGFLFVTLFFVYLTQIKGKIFTAVHVGILYLIFLLAVFIREEGIMIVPMFIAYILVFDKEKINKKNIRAYIVLSIGLVAFVLMRYISQILNTTNIPEGLRGSYGSVVYNLVSLPIKFVVQNIVSGVRIFRLLVSEGSHIYSDTQISVLGTYPVFMDLIFSMIFIVLSTIYSIWLLCVKNKKILSIIVFCIIWLLCNDIILAFVGRRLYIVEERYLYFSSFPVLLLVSIFLWSLFRVKSKHFVMPIATKFLSVCLLAFLLVSSYVEIQDAVRYKSFNGKARKSLFTSITALYPTIPNNTIFYFRCKGLCHRNELFGLSSEWVLPFSSGAGWNLLVLYSGKQEQIWGKFLTSDFLLNLNSQGYKRIGEDGFGYFTDKALVKKTLREHQMVNITVIALEYNEDNFTVKDISTEFRLEIGEK